MKERAKARERLQKKIKAKLAQDSSNSNFDSIKFIRDKYKELFNSSLPKDVHIELIILKIDYELLIRSYEVKQVSVPERLMQNYKASRTFSIDKMAPGLQGIMKAKCENSVLTKLMQ